MFIKSKIVHFKKYEEVKNVNYKKNKKFTFQKINEKIVYFKKIRKSKKI